MSSSAFILSRDAQIVLHRLAIEGYWCFARWAIPWSKRVKLEFESTPAGWPIKIDVQFSDTRGEHSVMPISPVLRSIHLMSADASFIDPITIGNFHWSGTVFSHILWLGVFWPLRFRLLMVAKFLSTHLHPHIKTSVAILFDLLNPVWAHSAPVFCNNYQRGDPWNSILLWQERFSLIVVEI